MGNRGARSLRLCEGEALGQVRVGEAPRPRGRPPVCVCLRSLAASPQIPAPEREALLLAFAFDD